MWQGRIIFAALSTVLVSACSLQTTEIETPTVATNEQITQNYAVYFPFDSAKFDHVSVDPALTSALQALSAKILLRGHTDRAGPAEYNMKLAKRRADAVAAAFVNAGISPDAIEISVRGEAEPQTPTSDGQAEATNRRVDIAIVSTALARQATEPAAARARSDDCAVMPVYVAGTRLFSCVRPIEQVSTQ